MDERQRLTDEANRLQERRRRKQEEQERRQALAPAAEEAFRGYREALTALFGESLISGREPPSPHELLRQLYPVLVRTCEAFKACGIAERWPRVDRAATRHHYSQGGPGLESARLAFDYGCLLLDRAFAGTLTQEEINHGWDCVPFRGCFDKARILLAGLCGTQLIKFTAEVPGPQPTPPPAPEAAMPPRNSFQQLLDFVQAVYDQEYDATPREPGQQRPCGPKWDAHFRRQEACLRRLLDHALIDAERAGVDLPEVEQRVQALAEHAMRMLLWPMHAPPMQPRRDGGHCDVQAQEYLIGRLNEMRPALVAVRTLAVRAERRAGHVPPQPPPAAPAEVPATSPDPVSLLIDSVSRMVASCAATLRDGADWGQVVEAHSAVRCSLAPPRAPAFNEQVAAAIAFLVRRGIASAEARYACQHAGDVLTHAFHWPPVPGCHLSAEYDGTPQSRALNREVNERLRAYQSVVNQAHTAAPRLQILAASTGLDVISPCWDAVSVPRPKGWGRQAPPEPVASPAPPELTPPTDVRAKAPPPRAGMLRDVADFNARKIGNKKPSFAYGKGRSVRKWAKAIGCSEALVCKLPYWIETRPQKPGSKEAAPAPKAVGLTPELEANLGTEKTVLEELIEDQERDLELSPLDDLPARPRRGNRRRP